MSVSAVYRLSTKAPVMPMATLSANWYAPPSITCTAWMLPSRKKNRLGPFSRSLDPPRAVGTAMPRPTPRPSTVRSLDTPKNGTTPLKPSVSTPP